MVEQHSVSVRLKAELARLVKLARTSDRPPEALLAEMSELEKEQATFFGKTSTLEERLNAIHSHTGAVEDERELISKLAHAADQRSRLRLRQLIRKRVKCIEVFPHGAGQIAFPDAPARAKRLLSFRITFTDELVNWVCCSKRNPKAKGAVVKEW